MLQLFAPPAATLADPVAAGHGAFGAHTHSSTAVLQYGSTSASAPELQGRYPQGPEGHEVGGSAAAAAAMQFGGRVLRSHSSGALPPDVVPAQGSRAPGTTHPIASAHEGAIHPGLTHVQLSAQQLQVLAPHLAGHLGGQGALVSQMAGQYMLGSQLVGQDALGGHMQGHALHAQGLALHTSSGQDLQGMQVLQGLPEFQGLVSVPCTGQLSQQLQQQQLAGQLKEQQLLPPPQQQRVAGFATTALHQQQMTGQLHEQRLLQQQQLAPALRAWQPAGRGSASGSGSRPVLKVPNAHRAPDWGSKEPDTYNNAW